VELIHSKDLWSQILVGQALAEKTQDQMILAAIQHLTNAYSRATAQPDKRTTLKQPELYAWNCITNCRHAYLTLYGVDVINGA
jgi:hypothetical protein